MVWDENAKFLKSHHKELWNIADQFFTQLLLETMYVPLSNTPEIPLDDKDVYRAGNDKGPQSLVTFDIRSHLRKGSQRYEEVELLLQGNR